MPTQTSILEGAKSVLGQKQTFAVQNRMSALPPKADITCPFRKRHPQIWTTPGSNSLFSRTNSLFLRECCKPLNLHACRLSKIGPSRISTAALTRPGAMKAIEIAC